MIIQQPMLSAPMSCINNIDYKWTKPFNFHEIEFFYYFLYDVFLLKKLCQNKRDKTVFKKKLVTFDVEIPLVII